MTLKTATLSLATLALIGCDGMGNKRTTADARTTDARESSATVTPAAPRVVSAELGRQAGESLRITEETSRFSARDTMYLAVLTTNAASDSRLSARWTFQDGTVVDSSGQGVARSTGTAAAVTQFRVSRDSGWLVGDYSVDIWLNDRFIEKKTFVVER